MPDQDQDSALAEFVKPDNFQAIAPDSDDVKKLLSVMDALGDSLNQSDRAKFEGLIARARAASAQA